MANFLHFLIIFLSVVNHHHVSCFKSDFEYYKQIYLNSSSWIVQLQYNFSKMEISATNFVELCTEAPTQLKMLKSEIESVSQINFNSSLKLINRPQNFVTSVNACLNIASNCQMATISTENEYSEIRRFLSNNLVDRAYLNYHTSEGKLVQNDRVVSSSSFMGKQAYSLKTCPEPFQSFPIGDRLLCVFIDYNKRNKHEASKHCFDTYKARLLIPRDYKDMNAIKTLASPPGDIKYFWFGGQYNAREKDLTECRNHSPDPNLNGYMDWKRNCLHLIHDNNANRRYGSVCSKEAKFDKLYLEDPNSRKIFNSDFKKFPAALSFQPYHGTFILENKQLLLPTVCRCQTNEQYRTLSDNYKQSLLSKVSTALSTIEKQCQQVLTPIKASPYIVYDEHQLNHNRQKRFLPAIMSVFRSIGGALGGFASRAAGSAGAAANVAGAAGRTGSSLITKAKTFLPSLKQTAYVSTVASALGVSALAIDQHLKASEFQSQLIPNMAQTLNNTFQVFTSAKKFTDLMQNAQRLNALQSYVATLNNALQTSVMLNSISASIDELLLDFSSKAVIVKNHFDVYNKIIETLVSKVFTDSLLIQAILDASTKLPSTYAFLSENVFDLINSATVTYELENSVLLVDLLIPIVSTKNCLFLFKGKPLPYSSAQDVAILPKYEAEYIAVSRDSYSYALINPSDLLPCIYKDMYLCNSLPLYTSQTRTCMYSHFMDNSLDAQDCYFYKLGNSNVFELTSSHILYYYVPKRTTALKKCLENGHNVLKGTYILNGTGEMYVTPGCSVEIGNEFIGLNPKMPNNTVTREQFNVKVHNTDKMLDLTADASQLDGVHVPVPILHSQSDVDDMPMVLYFGKIGFMIFGVIILVLIIIILSILYQNNAKFRNFCLQLRLAFRHMCCNSCSAETSLSSNDSRQSSYKTPTESDSVDDLLSYTHRRPNHSSTLISEPEFHSSHIKDSPSCPRYEKLRNLNTSLPGSNIYVKANFLNKTQPFIAPEELALRKGLQELTHTKMTPVVNADEFNCSGSHNCLHCIKEKSAKQSSQKKVQAQKQDPQSHQRTQEVQDPDNLRFKFTGISTQNDKSRLARLERIPSAIPWTVGTQTENVSPVTPRGENLDVQKQMSPRTEPQDTKDSKVVTPPSPSPNEDKPQKLYDSRLSESQLNALIDDDDDLNKEEVRK